MRRNSAGQLYRSRRRITPDQVRERRFPYLSWGRRGVDSHDVHRFLCDVADELAETRSELRQAVDENTRIKQALRDWQAEQANARAYQPTAPGWVAA
ncbi:hypothetical protein [Micromonospora sp. NBC_01813]|uniref:hypothetical protein n=1 Tax=Micromonospora sp. NBC_01813 TaxID=2975988 RepID=UPI002DD9CD85|nr:hypothetical protein [Micromonospora sp. NBC_01813]WSA09413.1 hypothetical protein OG958_00835 [Micromonospora sp. NBC_01813]